VECHADIQEDRGALRGTFADDDDDDDDDCTSALLRCESENTSSISMRPCCGVTYS
jgi:hypothetical protein